MSAEPRVEEVRFEATDAVGLAGTVFTPSTAPRGAVVIASAMGVPRRLYARFAAHLAGASLETLTFDYRGIGDSAPPTLRGFEARLHEWGERDLDAALRWLGARRPGLPRFLVGHSVGGQIAGLAPESEHLAGLLAVASQSGHWRLWPGPRRWLMAAFWWGAIPSLTRVFGYYPMAWTLGGEDLPAGVALEWARWGRDREYVLGWAREQRGGASYERIVAPIRAYAMADDPFAPRPTVEGFLRFFPRARVELREVSPRELGVRAVGHFGFFRESVKETLWREAASWLEART